MITLPDDILILIFKNFETYNMVFKQVSGVCTNWWRVVTEGESIKKFYVTKIVKPKYCEWWVLCNIQQLPEFKLTPEQNELDLLCKLSLFSPHNINLFNVDRRRGKTSFIADIVNRMIMTSSNSMTIHCFTTGRKNAGSLLKNIRKLCPKSSIVHYDQKLSSLVTSKITVICMPSTTVPYENIQPNDVVILDEYPHMSDDFLDLMFSIKELTLWGFGTHNNKSIQWTQKYINGTERKIVEHDIPFTSPK